MPSPSPSRRRPQAQRDQGPGASEGIVLDLEQTGSGAYDVAYVISARIGRDNPTNVSIQVDTGSSDLWITSTDCTSSLCNQSRKYNPASSTLTGRTFSIQYLQGQVSGPIVWDRVEIGGYAIDNQALAAANNIVSEPLSDSFNGILGLALPLNSIIAELIPPVISNDPDGAAWPSNLFSITPFPLAPSARFLSLSLSRPGSAQIPSLLGIGRHPENLPAAQPLDPARIEYSTVIPDSVGTLFWKASVRAITIYADGERREVQLPRSVTGRPWPTAVLDSGVPLILTTSRLANAIYGGIGIGPADDGQYYVPCTQPLNITISLDDRPEIPLHPLDLTTEPPRDNQSPFCIGLIQSADAFFLPGSAPAAPSIGDIILGVPFMRNVYTVMAYTVPNEDGTFVNGTDVDPDEVDLPLRPRLGLLGLTNATQALREFDNVRKYNKPIDDTPGSNSGGGGGGGGGGNGQSDHSNSGGGRSGALSVGVIVLISLLGFFGACLLLFAGRWWCLRRQEKKEMMLDAQHGGGGGDESGAAAAAAALMATAGGGATLTAIGSGGVGRKKTKRPADGAGGEYELARRVSMDADDHRDGLPSEDTLREIRFKEYLRKQGVDAGEFGALLGGKAAAVGAAGRTDEEWDPETALNWDENDDTLVARRRAPVPGVTYKDDKPPSLADFLPKSFSITSTTSTTPPGTASDETTTTRTTGTGSFTISDERDRYRYVPKHGHGHGSHGRSMSMAAPLLPLVQEEDGEFDAAALASTQPVPVHTRSPSQTKTYPRGILKSPPPAQPKSVPQAPSQAQLQSESQPTIVSLSPTSPQLLLSPSLYSEPEQGLEGYSGPYHSGNVRPLPPLPSLPSTTTGTGTGTASRTNSNAKSTSMSAMLPTSPSSPSFSSDQPPAQPQPQPQPQNQTSSQSQSRSQSTETSTTSLTSSKLIGGGMAGVGTHARGSVNLDAGGRFRFLPTPAGVGSGGVPLSPPPGYAPPSAGFVPPSLPVGSGGGGATPSRSSSS